MAGPTHSFECSEWKAKTGGMLDRILVRLLGWKAIILRGDPCVYDRWRWIKCHLSPGPLRTLDAGCGSGAFTMYASRIGNESVGLSFDERNNSVAQRRARELSIPNIRLAMVDLRELDQYSAELGTFDQIICLETIEHVRNDAKLIADLSALLKPGGKLLLTTPFKHHRPLLGDSVSECEDGGHLRWGYTHQEMRQLFGEFGLDVTVEEYVSGFVSQKLCDLIRILSKMDARFALAATLPLRVFQFLDSPLTRLMNYPYLSISVVGVKRAGDNERRTLCRVESK